MYYAHYNMMPHSRCTQIPGPKFVSLQYETGFISPFCHMKFCVSFIFVKLVDPYPIATEIHKKKKLALFKNIVRTSQQTLQVQQRDPPVNTDEGSDNHFQHTNTLRKMQLYF